MDFTRLQSANKVYIPPIAPSGKGDCMPVVGFGLTKISAEKLAPARGKVDIKNNVAIIDVIAADLTLGKDKNNAVKFVFEFSSAYEPGIGKILLQGEVLFMDDSAKITGHLDSWKKDKKVSPEVMPAILNTVFSKCHIQALIISQEVNLPSPIPMPKLGITRAATTATPATTAKKAK